jgi:hypothetical protein
MSLSINFEIYGFGGLCMTKVSKSVSKSKVSNDLDENSLNNGTFVSSGHLEFLRHFKLLFLKIHNILFLWSNLPKYVIRATLKLIAHGKVSYN